MGKMGVFHKPSEVDCSFCGKAQSRVRKLIAGPRGVFICHECVDLCNDIFEEEGFSLCRNDSATTTAAAGAAAVSGLTAGPAGVSAAGLAAEFGLSEETASAILAWVFVPPAP